MAGRAGEVREGGTRGEGDRGGERGRVGGAGRRAGGVGIAISGEETARRGRCGDVGDAEAKVAKVD